MRSRDLQFGAPVKSKSTKKSPSGRVCDTAGCETVLSVYNGATRCSVHEPFRMGVSRPRG